MPSKAPPKIKAKAISEVNTAPIPSIVDRGRWKPNLLLQLDATLGPVVFENDIDGLDDLLAGIGLAINDDLVLQLSGAADQHDVLLGKAVIPAAIPGGQIVRVFLECACQLSAGQFLNIDISVGARIGLEFDLCTGLPRNH